MTLPHLFGGPFAGFVEWLLRASVSATVLAALVLLAQGLLGRWLTPTWRYRLWGVVVIRLLLPTAPSAMPSMWNMQWAPPSSNAREPAVAMLAPIERTGKSQSNAVVLYGPVPIHAPVAARQVSAATASASRSSAPFRLDLILIEVWFCVACILLIRLIASSISLARRLRRAQSVTDPAILALLEACRAEMGLTRRPNLLITDAVRAPAVAGVWNPRILLPPNLLGRLSPQEQRAVILHELAHLRCADLPANWLLALLAITHWFNPLLRIAFARLRADREAARDAMVLGIFSRDDAPAAADSYSRTLLKLAESLLNGPPSVGRASGLLPGFFAHRSGLRRRLESIHDFPRTSRRIQTAGPLIALLLVACTLVTAGNASRAGDTARSNSDHPNPSPNVSATRPSQEQSVPEMVAEVHRLVARADYPAAMALSERILAIDPQNHYASTIRPWLAERVAFEDRRDAKVPSTLLVQKQLDHVYPQLEFNAARLSDVIDYFRDSSGAKIFVNWRSLESEGIRRDAPVSVRLGETRLSAALQAVLNAAAGGAELRFTVDEDVITVSTADDLSKNVVVRVYDIRRLLGALGDASPARPAGPTTEPAAVGAGRDELVRSIVQLIEDTVAYGTWKDHGGSLGAIRELQGQLIVTQTSENQHQIYKLLDEAEESHGSRIELEAKFVRCDGQLAHELLSDWQKTAAPATRPDGTKSQASAYLLDEGQLHHFLRAATDAAGFWMVDSPSIKLISGQRAYVMMPLTHTAYTRDFAAVTTPDGQVRFDPIRAEMDNGMLLDVQGTIGPDRTITLSLRSQVSALLGMKHVRWTGAPADAQLRVEEPLVRSVEFSTTASIPQGRTLVVGGVDDPASQDQPAISSRALPTRRSVFLLVRPKLIVLPAAPQTTLP